MQYSYAASCYFSTGKFNSKIFSFQYFLLYSSKLLCIRLFVAIRTTLISMCQHTNCSSQLLKTFCKNLLLANSQLVTYSSEVDNQVLCIANVSNSSYTELGNSYVWCIDMIQVAMYPSYQLTQLCSYLLAITFVYMYSYTARYIRSYS